MRQPATQTALAVTPATISIIMPAFNQERFIGEAIASVIAQSYTHWELFVIDDGSTDNTSDVVQRFSHPQIRLLSQENQGVSAARNRGIQEASGDYIAFLDADDVYVPHTLHALLTRFQSAPHIGLSYGGYVRINEDNQMLSSYRPPDSTELLDLLTGFPITISCSMVSRRWHSEADFNTAYSINEDRDYFIRLAKAGCNMQYASGALVLRRVYKERPETSLSEKIAVQQEIFDHYASQVDVAALIRPVLDEVRRSFFVEWAFQSAQNRDVENTLRCLQQAATYGAFTNQQTVDRVVTQLAEAATRTAEEASVLIERFETQLAPTGEPISGQLRRVHATALLLEGMRTALWPNHRGRGDIGTAIRILERADQCCASISPAIFWLMKYDLDCAQAYRGHRRVQETINQMLQQPSLSHPQQTLLKQLAERSPTTAGARNKPGRWLRFVPGLATARGLLHRVNAKQQRLVERLKSGSHRQRLQQEEPLASATVSGTAPQVHTPPAQERSKNTGRLLLVSIDHPDAPEQYTSQLEAVAELQGEFERLEYIMVSSDRPGALPDADLFIAPATPSDSSLAALQRDQVTHAQEQGIAVVAEQDSTAAQCVAHQLTGWLVQGKTRTHWQLALRELLGDSALHQRIANMAATQRALELAESNAPFTGSVQ